MPSVNVDLDAVPNLSGFDTYTALTRIGGKWDRLEKLIRTFIKNNLEADTELAGFLAESKTQAAIELVHQIRASGANIGAEDLANVAGVIESRLRSGQSVPDAIFGEFAYWISELSTALMQLDEFQQYSWRSSDSADQSKSASMEDIENCLHEIHKLLHRDVALAEENLERLVGQCRGSQLEGFADHLLDEFCEFNIPEISKSIESYFSSRPQ